MTATAALEPWIELEEIIAGFSIAPTESSYVLCGRTYETGAAALAAADSKETRNMHGPPSAYSRKYLVSHLGSMLYRLCHCRQQEGAHENEGSATTLLSNPRYRDSRDFVESLSQANRGRGTWEPGWEISRVEKNGQLAVRKDGLTLWVLPSRFVPDDGKIEAGKKGHIAMPKEFRSLLPGFYMANGNAPIDQSPPIVRIYWNINSEGATTLLKNITVALNKEDVPFQFKVLSNPRSFTRADAGVLYVSKKHLGKSTNALSSVHHNVKSFLKPQTPLFAKRLAPGVSLAEDPNNGESFGQHRTRILAESLYSIHEKGIDSAKEKKAEVSAHFAISGVDIMNAPHVNKGSTDNYGAVLAGVFDRD